MSKKNMRNMWRRKSHYNPTHDDYFYKRVYGAYKRFVRRTYGQLSNYYSYDKFLEQIKYFGSESTYFNLGYDMLVAELKGETKQYIETYKSLK